MRWMLGRRDGTMACVAWASGIERCRCQGRGSAAPPNHKLSATFPTCARFLQCLSIAPNIPRRRLPASEAYARWGRLLKSGFYPCNRRSETTFNDHYRGRYKHTKEDANKLKQTLTPEEEEYSIEICGNLSMCGFPVRTWFVVDIARSILQRRAPWLDIGPRWIDKCFYKCHPECRNGFSSKLDAVRAGQGGYVNLLLLFSKYHLLPLIRKREITAETHTIWMKLGTF